MANTLKALFVFLIILSIIAGEIFRYYLAQRNIVSKRTYAYRKLYLNETTGNLSLPYMYEAYDFDYLNKTILIWTDFMEKNVTKINLSKKCKISNCLITYARNLTSIAYYDAIIFNAANINLNDLPRIRGVYQRYIFYSLAAPYEVKLPELLSKNFFNWTMTYRSDSDIHYPYKYIRKINNTSKNILRNVTTKKILATYSSYVINKRHLKFIQQLRKYIPINVFNEFSIDGDIIAEKYKFFFVFEKYDCQEYITDTLYKYLNLNIIPVVFGFYDFGNLPPNSVINAVNFKNPEELARYLKYLYKNLTAYEEYFEWKKNYVIEDSTDYVICQLCRRLNCLRVQHKTYEDVQDWFYGLYCYN